MNMCGLTNIIQVMNIHKIIHYLVVYKWSVVVFTNINSLKSNWGEKKFIINNFNLIYTFCTWRCNNKVGLNIISLFRNYKKISTTH